MVLIHLLYGGQDVLGVGLEAPLTLCQVIYTLPMLTVKEDKGQLICCCCCCCCFLSYFSFLDIHVDSFSPKIHKRIQIHFVY